MDRIGLVGLVKIELPDGHGDVLLCDGGFQVWGAETYRSSDPVFGSIGGVVTPEEGVGDMVPALELTLQPDASAAPADLIQPGFQKCRARFWIAEFDLETEALVGTPDLLFDGQLDQMTLTVGASTREVAASVVSLAERLFARNSGNSLSPAFHKSVWPGELGHDNATGLVVNVAWGTANPNSGQVGFGDYLRNAIELAKAKRLG